jgi:hypothetical protein
MTVSRTSTSLLAEAGCQAESFGDEEGVEVEASRENEQFFFDSATLEHLARFISRWPAPCCLCAPMLGRRLVECGVEVTILDIDERFADTRGFRRFDVLRPEWLGQEFGLIVCDPPFFNVTFSQLFDALRVLSRYRWDQPLLLSYYKRREASLLATFAPFGLRPTGYRPRYLTIRDWGHNEIEFYGNLADTDVGRLLTGVDGPAEQAGRKSAEPDGLSSGGLC